ncbi:MAG: response regulator transcription factor [bacterium]|nr:response regulator transcription factor [bacterium]
MKIKVLLADDHTLVRQGLCSLIAREPDMLIVGEAYNGRIAVQLVHERRPNVLVMDVAMPDLNGIEATRQILTKYPEVRIIGLSMHSDRRYVMEMLKVGAAGYLLKDCAFEELITAIRTVNSNQIYLSPPIADIVLKDYIYRLKNNDASVYSILTAREREVLQLLAEGKSTKQIAASLKISIKTVETYRQQIMDKLNIYSIADLTKYAIKEGLVSLDT